MLIRNLPRRYRLANSNNHERWLISYSDFMTLLFAFFVVMYAVSSINEEKYKELANTLVAVFDHEPTSLDPVQVGDPTLAASPHVVDASEAPGYEAFESGDVRMRTSKEIAESELGGFADAQGISVETNDHWLEISLDSEVAFAPGEAVLSVFAIRFLDEIADYLLSFEHPITIEGYTDNVPAEGGNFPSNWALSSARAAAVASYLQGKRIDEARISAVGYGENHPVATNATPEGRARNRRVVLVVAHEGNLPRNLNTAPSTSAFAYVRHAEEVELDEGVQQRRTDGGGLIFTNEPDSQ